MKLGNKVFLAVVLIAAILIARECACSRNEKPIEGKRTTQVVRPESNEVTVVTDTVYKDRARVIYVTKPATTNDESELYLEQYEELVADLVAKNKQQAQEFKKANDSTKAAMLADASKINVFSHKFTQKDLEATVSGVSRGTVEGLKLEYTLSPAPRYINVMLDGKVGVDRELTQGVWQAGLSVNNDGKNTYSAALIGVGSQAFIAAGYSTRIFRIRKK